MSAPSEPDPDEQLGPIDLQEIELPGAHVSAAPDPDGQALIYREKIAPLSGGWQGGDFSAFLA